MGEEGSFAIAIYDYKAQQNEELTIKKNEKLMILDDSESWWRVKNDKHLEGYVPSNYIKTFKSKKSWKNIFGASGKKSSDSTNGPSEYCTPDDIFGSGAGGNKGDKVKCIAVAKFAYKPMRDDEVELKRGEKILVLEKEGDGWWKGQVNGKVGWFPSNYAEEAKIEEVRQVSEVICNVVTLYRYQSQSPEEMNFEKDERLEIVEQPETDPEWWKARKSDGTLGLVPKNYVKIVDNSIPLVKTSDVAFPQPTQNAGRKNSEPASSSPHRIITKKISTDYGAARSFSSQAWFWGKISRGDSEKLLSSQGGNGDFLVRESETKVRRVQNNINFINEICLIL